MKYTLLEKDKMRFIGLVLLNEIINQQAYPPVKTTGEDVYIDHYLKELNTKGMLVIKDGFYEPTEIGRNELVTFYERYNEFIQLFDLYCAVDLEAGEFAFARMFENFDDEQWAEFLSNERFSDVRVAVAEFKGINPIEIVFMSFMQEGRFDVGVDRWQYNLTGNDVWNEILEICDSAITKEYLETDGVLEDIIKQGSILAIDLMKQAQAIEESENQEFQQEQAGESTVTEEVITEEVVEYVDMPYYDPYYYDPYYDPYYISPIWVVPLLLW